MHYGPVYEYIDINGNPNFAGNGINIVARIGSQTDSNRVLISKECADFLPVSYTHLNKRIALAIICFAALCLVRGNAYVLHTRPVTAQAVHLTGNEVRFELPGAPADADAGPAVALARDAEALPV